MRGATQSEYNAPIDMISSRVKELMMISFVFVVLRVFSAHRAQARQHRRGRYPRTRLLTL